MKKLAKKYEDGGSSKSSSKSTSRLSNRVTRLGKLEQAMSKDTGRGDMDQLSRYNTVAAKLERAKNKLAAKTPMKKMGGMTKSKKK